MLNREKKRNIKRNLKRVAIVGVPLVILCTITYASITSLSHAGESTYAFENFYDNPAYSDNNSEYDNINSMSEVSETGSSDSDGEEEVITNHDNVVLDTAPDSITVLVNKELRLPSDYIPNDLVVPDISFSFHYYDEKKLMRKEAAEALKELFTGAETDNILLNGVSAYRSYDRQYEIFTDNVKKQGLKHTMKYSATPGYSEHQTGLAIDVSAKSVNNRLDESFGKSAEGRWLAENCHLYGFIIRYPEDKTEITGYSYEPWHIRYVGKPLAKYIYENNLCLEEYYNFKPTIDYSDQLSYDNLEDYGIDLADVIPTPTPTKVPTKEPEEETADDKNTEEDKDTADDGKSTKDDSDTGKPSDGKGDEDNSGGTKDDSDGNTQDDGDTGHNDDGNGTPPGDNPPSSGAPAPADGITPTPPPEGEHPPTPTVTP